MLESLGTTFCYRCEGLRRHLVGATRVMALTEMFSGLNRRRGGVDKWLLLQSKLQTVFQLWNWLLMRRVACL